MTDPVKEAFSKVKDDMSLLKEELTYLKAEILELKRTLSSTDRQTDQQTFRHNSSAEINSDTTQAKNTTHFPANNYPLEAVRESNFDISTRNRGVQTNRQTDQQTDISTGNEGVLNQKFAQNIDNVQNPLQTISETYTENQKTEKIDKLEHIATVLSSLDDIKKDLRKTFKKLTKQEMAVFTAIYQLEEQGFTVDYSIISQKLGLTESSIRDYVQRIINKHIPILKEKENNKKIVLKVSENLRKITSLQTILQLRSI